MSMHLRGSRDMMGQEEEGWWKSRTGLEQKLIILTTLLFIVAFSLTITVIVLKNRAPPDCGTTTISPTPTGTGPTEETVSTSEISPTESSDKSSETTIVLSSASVPESSSVSVSEPSTVSVPESSTVTEPSTVTDTETTLETKATSEHPPKEESAFGG